MVRSTEGPEEGSSCPAGQDEKSPKNRLVGVFPQLQLQLRTEVLKRAVSYCGPEKGSSCLPGQDEDVLEDGLVGVSPHQLVIAVGNRGKI
jgi:hypothetical protein